ncbi:glutamine amidotransferase family protein [Candidatus Woesearchaeota archaeon]|nr:glutamine amidotransferase family protein [Candidatus Woesearchaeota archaeon]
MILNKYRTEKDISACGLFGFINEDGKRQNGEIARKAMALMRERSNGLGGGFAAYGIYPEYDDLYAFHVMYDDEKSKERTEEFLSKNFIIGKDEKMPHRHVNAIKTHPLLWRYFLKVKEHKQDLAEIEEKDFVVKTVMQVNSVLEGAYIFSSGKNMGIFKAVGYPEDVADFFKIEDYHGYIWTAHGRFPTNTPGWWGGAHPFGLLNWSVVHNGEISSYGANKRYLEMFGYKCTLMTDTEVVAYLADLLMRKHQISIEKACSVLAPRFWKDIEGMSEKEKKEHTLLRQYYGSAMLNGPFAVLIANEKNLIGVNDRIKLRPLVAARRKSTLYIASEESAILEVCEKPDKVWHPKAGIPTIGTLKDK